jgi:hypothetical protein
LRNLTGLLLAVGILSAGCLPVPQAMAAATPGSGIWSDGTDLPHAEEAHRTGYRQPAPPPISVRQCMYECQWRYGPCNSPSDLAALDCKISRDRCEARCFGR